MSDADTLRHAAFHIRERALAATPGPWTTGQDGLDGDRWLVEPVPLDGRHWRPICALPSSDDDEDSWRDDRPDAEHIASWHPQVALAVADLLASVENEIAVESERFETGDIPYVWTSALIVARAYLGEQS